jgi:branched-chain amino acid transport system ATP-binding protein
MAELLSLEHVTAGYGDAIVIDDASLSLDDGDSLAVLGRNGVGKTTLLRTLMGLTTLHAGAIRFRQERIETNPVHERADAGLGWVPQERGVFASLTVEEHLTVVARPGPWDLKRVFDTFPALAKRRQNLGNRLSGGEQQLVAMGRALSRNPRVLLLDEPTEGLAPIIVDDIKRVVRDLVQSGGMAVVLVEQHARLALSLTRRAIVLERGRIAHQAASAELLNDPERLHRLVAVNAGV